MAGPFCAISASPDCTNNAMPDGHRLKPELEATRPISRVSGTQLFLLLSYLNPGAFLRSSLLVSIVRYILSFFMLGLIELKFTATSLRRAKEATDANDRRVDLTARFHENVHDFPDLVVVRVIHILFVPISHSSAAIWTLVRSSDAKAVLLASKIPAHTATKVFI